MFFEIIPVTPIQQNCSILGNDDLEAIVVDPGGDLNKIVAKIEQKNLKLKVILLTHAHWDHIGAALELAQKYNVEILGSHIDDKPLFQNLSKQSSYGAGELKPFLPDRFLNDGDIINYAGFEFEIFHLPGHSPGHIGFINHNNNFAITGDVLFNRSIGRTDLPGGNYETLINSIKQKLFQLDDDYYIFPGHGDVTQIGFERVNNPFVGSKRHKH